MSPPVNIAVATPAQNFCDHIFADRPVGGHPFGGKSTRDEISQKSPEIRICFTHRIKLVTVNTPVARVADFKHLVVPLSVSAQELGAIQQLDPEFDILLDGKTARAAIEWINPEFDEKTRKLSIELILRSYPGPKRGGLTCRLALQTVTEGVWVPKQAVISRYENPRVFLKKTGAEVKVLVLGQAENHFIIADDPRLPPGAVLQAPAASRPEPLQEPAR